MKNVSDKPFHGYLGSRGSPLVPPIRESVGIELGNGQSFEAVDSFVKLLWPSGNDHYRENVISYSNMVTEMAKLVKKMIFESYGMEKYYDSYIDSAVFLLRNIKYKIPEIGENKIGTDIHRDKTFITILHENGSKGLEIKTKNGDDWLGVDFSPNSFLVIAGEASMEWSKGRIHSATHRVVMRGTKERYSLGLFSFHKGIIEIPNEFLDDQNPLSFKSFNNYGMLKDYFTDEGNKTDYTAKA